jgi:GntR family transcriptional repressor for pyruvate dehydrogenase complex
MANAPDIAAVTRHDIVFHQAVARASGNGLFLQIVRSFEPLMVEAVPLAWKTRDTDEARRIVLHRHAEIACAIGDRDAQGAILLMNAHFDTAIGAVL